MRNTCLAQDCVTRVMLSRSNEGTVGVGVAYVLTVDQSSIISFVSAGPPKKKWTFKNVNSYVY